MKKDYNQRRNNFPELNPFIVLKVLMLMFVLETFWPPWVRLSKRPCSKLLTNETTLHEKSGRAEDWTPHSTGWMCLYLLRYRGGDPSSLCCRRNRDPPLDPPFFSTRTEVFLPHKNHKNTNKNGPKKLSRSGSFVYFSFQPLSVQRFFPFLFLAFNYKPLITALFGAQ